MRTTLILCVVILLFAGGLQLFVGVRKSPEKVRPPLAAILPAHMARWEVVDKPIAETAEMKKAVGELLNFDEAIFRTYARGGVKFDVYAAYWKPGKMSERLVSGHSPDVCWVAAGWQQVSRGGGALPQAEAWVPKGGQYRVFNDPRGSPRWVAFWHVADGRLVDYGSATGVPPWWTVFSDLARKGLKQRGSQYFVRVSANVPWSELSHEAGFREAMNALSVILD